MPGGEQVQRPLKPYWWPQLQRLYEERHGDARGIQEILAELLFRNRPGAIRLRETLVGRLVELSNESFAWPTTEAQGGDGSVDGYDWPQVGMLAYLGYHVGQNGVEIESRRQILDLAYASQLPNVINAEYTADWGSPRSGKRLQKMAESLAAFCRNQKRRNPAALAVLEWEEDLGYLKHKYYIGRYDFGWPSTELA